MVFETIWNCRENIENNIFKAYILMVFETIWNCRETNENNIIFPYCAYRSYAGGSYMNISRLRVLVE